MSERTAQTETSARETDHYSYTFSFAGDCTIGSLLEWQGSLDIDFQSVVKDDYATAQLLFGGAPEANGGYFYVIPRGQGESVNIEIDYDVLTLDSCLSTTLSGTKDFGSQVENQIAKNDIFGDGIDFEAGKQYDIHIHLGMTSVKIEAEVKPWDDSTPAADVDLPDNQPEGSVTPTPPTPAPTFADQVADALGSGVTVTPNADGSAVTVTGAPTSAADLNALFASLGNAGVTSISMDGNAYNWDANSSQFIWQKSDTQSFDLGFAINADYQGNIKSFELTTSGDLAGTINLEYE